MISRVKQDPSPSFSTVKELFDWKTKGGEEIGLNIELSPVDGYLTSVDSLMFHTIGLVNQGFPEIVIYLGPRKLESPIPEETAVDLSRTVLTAMSKLDQVSQLAKMMPLMFIIQGTAPRQFMRVPVDDTLRERLIHSKLSKLSAYYQSDSYDFILYEPTPWIH